MTCPSNGSDAQIRFQSRLRHRLGCCARTDFETNGVVPTSIQVDSWNIHLILLTVTSALISIENDQETLPKHLRDVRDQLKNYKSNGILQEDIGGQIVIMNETHVSHEDHPVVMRNDL